MHCTEAECHGVAALSGSVRVRNNYDMSDYGGEKLFVLSTMSRAGGKNEFLGAIYTAVGSACIFLACVFAALALCSRRKTPY